MASFLRNDAVLSFASKNKLKACCAQTTKGDSAQRNMSVGHQPSSTDRFATNTKDVFNLYICTIKLNRRLSANTGHTTFNLNGFL
jgi:hypothetical protein